MIVTLTWGDTGDRNRSKSLHRGTNIRTGVSVGILRSISVVEIADSDALLLDTEHLNGRAEVHGDGGLGGQRQEIRGDGVENMRE